MSGAWKHSVVFTVAAILLARSAGGAERERGLEFFETQIRPALVQHCYECHSAAAAEVEGGLRVDFRDGLRTGGDSGPAVVPGQPEQSLLLDAIRRQTFEMPPEQKLPAAVIADFERWIRDGAVDPRDQPPSPAEAAKFAWKAKLAERARWWSLQPLQNVEPPPRVDPAADPNGAADPVDRFIRAGLDDAGLTPAPEADAQTLVRRLSFVLTGLPPRPEQIESFGAAYSQDRQTAMEALVDQLLDSPHFGERFARHWMDVIRYTDTYGYEWDNPARGSWEYRDYLIRAFNRDVGFDRLIREQLAGDLLENPRINAELGLNESILGPMFYHLGEHRHGTSLEFNGIHQEMVNNKIDAFSKAFLASTVACARCHDHKLDAISQQDYYALAGVFMSPRWTTRVLDTSQKYEREIAELKQLRGEIQSRLASDWGSRAASLDGPSLEQWAADHRADLKRAKLGQIAYPLRRLAEAQVDEDAQLKKLWSDMAEQWRTAHEQRVAANRQFRVLTDFRQPGLPDGWVSEGVGFNEGYVRDGTPLVTLKGDQLVQQLLPRGYHTHALSSKLPGAIRLPAQDKLPGKNVSLQLGGGEWAGHLVIPQNAFQTETVEFFDQQDPSWTRFAELSLGNGVSRVRVEIATSSLNPNFPPRTGKARAGSRVLPPEDDGFDKRSWFSLTGIVTSDSSATPAETLDLFAPLYDGPTPASSEQAWERIGGWFRAAIERWACGEASSHDVRQINWLLANKLLPNRQSEAPEIAKLVRRYREVESRIDFARTANSMDERQIEPLNYRLNVRGNVDEEGPAVARDFLEVFADENGVGESRASGRLELARYLTSRRNPQAARVYVNRVWYWMFGTGLVATPNDFGRLGARPSHPELLDWLAAEFIREGWSTKQLVRKLALSRTFCQSGRVTEAARRRDPDNRLLHHYPTRRLEAESIRDSLLAVAGQLDPQLYGRPINPARSAEDPPKRLLSGPLDGRGRRSLYLEMSIMDPPKFLVGFNLPDLKLPTGRRDVTNVPAQALILLNDPLVVEMAEQWAAALVDDDLARPEERIRHMFLRALGRPPEPEELQRWTDAVQMLHDDANVMRDRQAWSSIAHALFNTSEFIYYR